MNTVTKSALKQLYPDTYEALFSEIKTILNKYNKTIKEKTFVLSHTDVILITYADGIIDEERHSLDVLNEFSSSYLKDIISAIHLLPFYPYSSDDGFSVIDYYQVKKEFGDWNSIKNLNDHFELMFDAVVNHISQHSDWFKGFLNKNSLYEDFFIEVDPNTNLSQVVRPRALPLFYDYKSKNETVNIWATFSKDQVDLNYSNYKVFVKVLDVLLFYISMGAKFIRLDAIAFLWKKLGTSCIHLDETHEVIKAYRTIIDTVAPQTVLITETNVPHLENISYFGNGNDEAHMVYNFTLPPLLAHTIHKQDISVLLRWAKTLKLEGKNTCFFNFTASHDGVGVRPLQGIIPDSEIHELAAIAEKHGGFVSYKNNSDGTQSPYELNCNYFELLSHPDEPELLRIKKFMLTQSVMLCMPGIPGIYYHSLLGSLNDRDAALNTGINRRINREKLEFKKLEIELNDNHSLRHSVFNEYKQLLKIRRSNKVFNPVGHANYYAENEVFIIERYDNNETFYALHNFSDKHIRINPLCEKGMDLLATHSEEKKLWELEPYDHRWIKKVI